MKKVVTGNIDVKATMKELGTINNLLDELTDKMAQLDEKALMVMYSKYAEYEFEDSLVDTSVSIREKANKYFTMEYLVKYLVKEQDELKKLLKWAFGSILLLFILEFTLFIVKTLLGT